MAKIPKKLTLARRKCRMAKLRSENYLAAAKICDLNHARRWGKKVVASASAAKNILHDVQNTMPTPSNELKMYIDGSARDLQETYANIEQAEIRFFHCFKKQGTNSLFPFEGGVKFVNPVLTKDPIVGTGVREAVKFRAKVTARCEDPCFISVYSIETLETGKRIDPPSNGDSRRGTGWNATPRDKDAFDGFVVDTDPKANSPCWPTSKFDQANSQLSAKDSPNFVEVGHRANFESCVVCMDGGKIKILGCIRWCHSNEDGIRFDKKQIGKHLQPSAPFERALQHWMNRR